MIECKTCEGNGRVTWSPTNGSCPACLGSGKIDEESYIAFTKREEDARAIQDYLDAEHADQERQYQRIRHTILVKLPLVIAFMLALIWILK